MSTTSCLTKGSRSLVLNITIRRSQYTQPTPLTSRLFVCDVTGCSKSYKRIHELRRHKRTLLGVKPYPCRYSQCSKSGLNGFVRKNHLRQHLRQVYQASH
ncbi:hypothetical protein BKA64DRAFT_688797 [Cadophora sp. MPI-SDFR-AT-0126]|nr:hypothetical protein BKA64DRAFT_688797 [Leotiomycetes sp. MPI-SDFR-AT-0126]